MKEYFIIERDVEDVYLFNVSKTELLEEIKSRSHNSFLDKAPDLDDGVTLDYFPDDATLVIKGKIVIPQKINDWVVE